MTWWQYLVIGSVLYWGWLAFIVVVVSVSIGETVYQWQKRRHQ